MTTPASGDFAGKVALVTGSTRGIGLATARRLARGGAKVVVTSRKVEACERTVSAFADEGLTAFGAAGHAGREEDVARMVAAAVDQFGGLDVAVANVAINPSFDPLAELSEEGWAKVMDTNVGGPLRLARHAREHLAARGGAMVMVSSVNAGFGMPRSGAYGVSKSALEQMTRQLAVEWGPLGVRCNAVSPGTTNTDMIRALMQRPGFSDYIRDATPLGRIGEPEDVAAAIAFLASDAARQITGQVLVVDGGQTIMRGTNSLQSMDG